MKRTFTFFICILPFSFLKPFLLNLLGHKISSKSKIGFSCLFVKDLLLEDFSHIGSFNIIFCNKVLLKERASIKKLNYIKGPIEIVISERASIQFLNELKKSSLVENNTHCSELFLGKNSFITRGNYVDLTRSVFIGENSILAGKGSQLWTHGFYHADKGPERIRIDGSITIGDNVYVGSRCTFNPGVSVGNSIHIGAGTIISKNLDKPGMYVGQGLRHIENSLDKIKSKLEFSHKHPLGNDIYIKD